MSHPDILATTNLPDPYPEDGAVKWIQGLGKRVGGCREYAFAVFNVEGELVGACGFIPAAGETGVVEIGCWIGRQYWNRGYATGALRLMLDFVFREARISRVRARTSMGNPASCRVLENLGFALRREVPNEHPRWSRQEVIRHYEVRREDWGSPPV